MGAGGGRNWIWRAYSTHPDLTGIPARQAEEEIRGSRDILEQKLQLPVLTFAYPYSRFDLSIVSLVSQSGFKVAYTYTPGHVGASGNERFSLQQIGVLATDTLEDFAGKVQASFRWRVRRRWRSYRSRLLE